MANTCRQIVDSASVRRRRRKVFVLLAGRMNGESRDFGFVLQHRLVVERTKALMPALEAGAQMEEPCQNSRDHLGPGMNGALNAGVSSPQVTGSTMDCGTRSAWTLGTCRSP